MCSLWTVHGFHCSFLCCLLLCCSLSLINILKICNLDHIIHSVNKKETDHDICTVKLSSHDQWIAMAMLSKQINPKSKSDGSTFYAKKRLIQLYFQVPTLICLHHVSMCVYRYKMIEINGTSTHNKPECG
jgi:hypothetical protein